MQFAVWRKACPIRDRKGLGLTEHTVKNYLFRIFDKLGVSRRVEVVPYVFRFRKDEDKDKDKDKDKDWMAASPSGPAPVCACGPKHLTTSRSQQARCVTRWRP